MSEVNRHHKNLFGPFKEIRGSIGEEMLPRAKTPIPSSIKQLRLWMIWMDIIKPFGKKASFSPLLAVL